MGEIAHREPLCLVHRAYIFEHYPASAHGLKRRGDRCAMCVSTVYACQARGEPKAADDATDARWFAESEIPWNELCFDHAEIVRDYFRWAKTGERRKL